MIWIKREFKRAFNREEEPDTAAELEQIMEKLNRISLESILAYDMLQDMKMRIEGDA